MSRVFTDEELAAARNHTGKMLKTADGKPYFPKREKEEAPAVAPISEPEPPKESPFQQEAISMLLSVTQASETNLTAVIANQSAIVDVMREMAKPKPKKKWTCPIRRNKEGVMISVEIQEV